MLSFLPLVFATEAFSDLDVQPLLLSWVVSLLTAIGAAIRYEI